MNSEIKRWGHSAAICLPKTILVRAKMDVDSPVSINVTDGKIVIEAVTGEAGNIRLPFPEADLLEGLDTDTAHADEMAT